ncbi:N-acetyl-gamma-glutamyl-phosphate reductase [Marinoscillum sp. MHG1-6]|uniref:N-acetyl-gamma-glutamyl-phosphate reductase n=1 Tax=Marinoscillum sp. MHG1-6 TaxID=2959627 RepID=UPI0021577D4E|nr:N-acetyl-gamma-glutamyl-phosphate reductase [Marinoscillum sp. MHG1-6]
MKNIKIGIIGATGYTGSELVRLLTDHPNAEIKIITSESRAGEKFSDVHPQFLNICDDELKSINEISNYDLDIVFLALPHGVSMDFVAKNHHQKFKIIDLSGDFRLKSKSDYEHWYKMDHHFPKGIEDAVYGLPELFRDRIKDSELVANPGCFPTASILPIAPLVMEGLVETDHIVIDAKTGVTGAGVKAKEVTHFPNTNDNFKAYGVSNHRHTIEIQEKVGECTSAAVTVLFTPHLLPVDRGIISSAYLKPRKKVDQELIDKVFADHYGAEPFVRYRKVVPHLKQVRGTNFCDVFAQYDERTNTIITMGVIDNLVKGAAGQAIQNMNIIMGLNETTGLRQVPLQP